MLYPLSYEGGGLRGRGMQKNMAETRCEVTSTRMAGTAWLCRERREAPTASTSSSGRGWPRASVGIRVEFGAKGRVVATTLAACFWAYCSCAHARP